MKGVLIGSDLMYRKDGSLAPIEINTNTGWDVVNRVETIDNVSHVEDLVAYCNSFGIEKVYLEGIVSDRIYRDLRKAGLEVEKVSIEELESIEDSDNILLVRSAYSTEAVVDSFCRDKIAFLDSLKGTNLEVEYLLKTESGFEGEITTLEDNGLLPNFILKYRYPNYRKKEYPKLYRFTSIEEIYEFAEKSLEEDFFLMPYYFCKDKLFENKRIQVIRNWSLFIANEKGSLDSIDILTYTKVCRTLELDKIEYEGNSLVKDRRMFLTSGISGQEQKEHVLLEENDLVWMADGSWKKIQDVRVGDLVKALDVPHPEDKDITKHTGDYGKTLEEFQTESTFTENEVTYLVDVERFVDKVVLTFTDGTDWFDTPKSSYPVVGDNGNVWFKTIDNLREGDTVLMLNISSPDEVVIETKTIENKSVERKIVRGYGIGLNGSHLFITRTSEDTQAYASIEHNATCQHACVSNANMYQTWPDWGGDCSYLENVLSTYCDITQEDWGCDFMISSVSGCKGCEDEPACAGPGPD